MAGSVKRRDQACQQGSAAVCRRPWPLVAGYLARAPATHVVLLVVVVTTLVLRGVDAPTATRVLRHQSTNLVQMSRDAPRVLLISAFLVSGGQLPTTIVSFTVLLAPLERWVGTNRWLLVFGAGHIGATLATTVGIWLQLRSGADAQGLVYPVDVGVSYGVAAAAGVLTFRLPRPARWAWAALLVGVIGWGLARDGTFTDWGHLAAVAIGLALGPLVHPGPSRTRRGAARWLGVTSLAMSAGLLMLFVTTPAGGFDVAPDLLPLEGTVVGPPAGCRPGCGQVVVGYPRSAGPGSIVMALPAGVLVRPGDRVPIPRHPQPGLVPRMASDRHHVDLRGLLGVVCAGGATVGVALITMSRKAGHRSVSSPGARSRQ